MWFCLTDTVNKVWEVAQDCLDENKKGWWVRMEEFGEAMDALYFGGKQVGEALDELECRAYVIAKDCFEIAAYIAALSFFIYKVYSGSIG